MRLPDVTLTTLTSPFPSRVTSSISTPALTTIRSVPEKPSAAFIAKPLPLSVTPEVRYRVSVRLTSSVSSMTPSSASGKSPSAVAVIADAPITKITAIIIIIAFFIVNILSWVFIRGSRPCLAPLFDYNISSDSYLNCYFCKYILKKYLFLVIK